MTSDRRVATGIFVLALIPYAYFFAGGGWNQNAIFDLTRALVERRTVWVDGYHTNTGDVVVRANHIYVNKPPGVSLLAALPYALLHFAGSDDLTTNVYLCTVAVSGVAGALIPAALFLYARRRLNAEPTRAALIALVTAFATPLFAYSTMLYLHVPSATLTLLSFIFVVEQRPFAAGLLTGLNVLCNYVAAPLVLIFGLGVLIGASKTRAKALFRFVVGTLPALVVLAWYQVVAFGGLLTNPATLNPAFTRESGEVLGAPSWRALAGITISPHRGLFFVAPVLVFGIVGWVLMLRRRRIAEAILIGAGAAVFIGVNICFNNWNAGSAYAPRYILPAVPLLAVAMLHVPLHRAWRLLFAALAFVSFVNNFAAVSVDPQVPMTVENPLFDYVYPLLIWGSLPPDVPTIPHWLGAFLKGHTSVNLQGVDEILPLVRRAPDSSDAQWVSFNLGEFAFSPGSAASLLPILVWMIVGSALLLRRAQSGAISLAPK